MRAAPSVSTMRVAQSAFAMSRLPGVESNQVVTSVERGESGELDESGLYFGGMFTGIGPEGGRVAQLLASRIASLVMTPPVDSKGRPNNVGARSLVSATDRLLKYTHAEVGKLGIDGYSGAAATAVFFKKDRLAAINVGPGWVAFYPDGEPLTGTERGDLLLTPHTSEHAKDKIRITVTDKIELDENDCFMGYRATRAIGLLGVTHVKSKAQDAEKRLRKQPGVLVAGGGSWGKIVEDRGVILRAVERVPTDMPQLVDDLVHIGTERTGDNVAVLAARIVL